MEILKIKAPLVAHVGDGNFHFGVVFDPASEEEQIAAKKFGQCVVDEGLKVGGTCTGEHGIGIGKVGYLASEHSSTMFLMRLIKQAFDPYNLFNPGKIMNNVSEHDSGKQNLETH